MNTTTEGSFQQNAVQQRLILEAAKDYAIFTTDLHRRVTTWNAGAEAMFGYTEADIIGHPADVLYVPEDRPHAPEYEATKARTEGRAENERWHLRQDGARIYGSGMVTPLRDEVGTIVGLVKIMRDLTRQKQAEEILRQSEEKYRTLFNSIDEGVSTLEVIVDEQGKANNVRYLENNPSVEKTLGIELTVGKTVREVIPEIEEHWIDAVGSVARTGSPVRTEYMVKGLDKWISACFLRVGDPDNRRVVAVYADITERKRHEANLVFLADMGKDLAGLTNIDDTMNALGAKIGAYFRASACSFAEIGAQGAELTLSHDWHADDVPSIIGDYQLAEYVSDEAIVTWRSGKPFVVADTQTDEYIGAEGYARLMIGSFITVPLVRDGEFRFILSIVDRSARNWRDDEIELLRELTNRIWTRLERARAEEALAESEEKYRSLFEFMQQGFGIAEIIVDEAGQPTDYRMLEINRQFEKLTGQPRENYLDGRTVRQVAPELEEDWYAFYGNVALTGKPGHRDIRVEGWNRWFEVSVYQTGQPEQRRIAILYSDITERKQAEERQAYLLRLTDVLRPLTDPVEIQFEAESLLGQHLGANRVGYAEDGGDGETITIIRNYTNGVPDIKGVYQYADYGFQLVSELRAGHTVVRDNIATQADLTQAEKQAHAVLQLGATVNVPLVKQGKLLAILFVHFAMPHTFSQYELALIEETAERTWAAVERAKSEAALRESQRFVQGIITSLPLVIYLFDLVERKSLYVSPQVVEVFGYLPGEMQTAGPNLLPTFFHPDDLPRIAGYFAQITGSTDEPVFSVECRMHHKQRGWIWVVCRGIVYARDGEGHPTQLLGTAEDITERKGAEEVLRLADQRKNEFLALLAHELRNPLATLNNTLLILQLTGGTHEAMPLPMATTLMEREVVHLVRLVDDLLDVSRISQGKIVLTKQRTDLVLVVRETVEAVDGGFRMANRTLTVDLLIEPLYLSGDATRLKQVVSNLLNNALKFTGTGGHVWISLQITNQEPSGPMALLRVRDDGIGIAAYERERIFQMFVQVDSSLGRTRDGLGLGLALVSELVGLHGGRVEVHSAGEGQGSEFSVYLPT